MEQILKRITGPKTHWKRLAYGVDLDKLIQADFGAVVSHLLRVVIMRKGSGEDKEEGDNDATRSYY